jgi:hypothetical protein
LVYDEVWWLQQLLVSPEMAASTGNVPNFDNLALLVDPADGAAG